MMTLVLILLTWSTAVFVCVLTLSSMRRAMRKLKVQQRAEHYARKRELAGLPPYDQREPLEVAGAEGVHKGARGNRAQRARGFPTALCNPHFSSLAGSGSLALGIIRFGLLFPKLRPLR